MNLNLKHYQTSRTITVSLVSQRDHYVDVSNKASYCSKRSLQVVYTCMCESLQLINCVKKTLECSVSKYICIAVSVIEWNASP